jgi:hypothetical protein
VGADSPADSLTTAETEGFEPSDPLQDHTLSRRAG